MDMFPPAILQRAKDIRVLLLDVDGVLTDGGLYFTENGETSKRFNTLDGHGLKLLQRAGVEPVIITGRDSAALRVRLNALNIQHAHFGVEDKHSAALSALQSLGLSWAQTAAMGDDWPDLPMLLPSTLACAPPNAHREVLSRVHWVTQAPAGHGAVREVCDLLLQARGDYAALLNQVVL
ncbi:MAG: HAD hydrolase family protein [Limnohabitans sp.]|jgi:3-deoxy-D-manno-octulosonate 8-phosphate phosphatase (KDO 8-P phosphatase)|nr:HAD hydrolase family protein [Limnohabitans sp.]MBP8021601.1 HAD hydrolase family protein [Limnohabitans sp.]